NRALARHEAELRARVPGVLHALALLVAALVARSNAAEGDRDVRRTRDPLVEARTVEERHLAAAAEGLRAGRVAAGLRATAVERLVHGGRVELERALLQPHLDEVPVRVDFAVLVDVGRGPVVADRSDEDDPLRGSVASGGCVDGNRTAGGCRCGGRADQRG